MFHTLWLRPFARQARGSRSRTAKPGGWPRFRPRIELLEGRVLLSTYWVRQNVIGGDCSTFGCGSLREAILESNLAPPAPFPHLIQFAIPPGSGPCQPIDLTLGALPAITQPVTIDGTTQPGSGGRPAIQLNGSSIPGITNGLTINASSTVVKGLVINGFSGSGIVLTNPGGNGPTNVVITDNYIGTDCTAREVLGNGNGVVLSGSGITNNVIGSIVPGGRNVISGNLHDGVHVGPGSVTGNRVEGNYIGTDVTGTTALGNGDNGVALVPGAASNTIGGIMPPGACVGACNLVSGNGINGITLFGQSGAAVTNNLVQGNYVGTDVTGTTAYDTNGNPLGNGFLSGSGGNGVSLSNQANNNTIAGNLLSGNAVDGLAIGGNGRDTPALLNGVQGNFIGTDRTGTTAYDSSGNPLGNGFSTGFGNGVSLYGGTLRNTIGGIGFGAGNIISGNAGDGVNLDDQGIAAVANNLVQGNYIGTDVTGTLTSDTSGKPLGNGQGPVGGNGVNLAATSFEASRNTIGGTVYGAGNVISGNFNDGVLIAGLGSSVALLNLVQGNYVGTDVTGTLALGNGNNGVEIYDAASNLIGGTVPGAGNVIANNGVDGVVVGPAGPAATGNVISQNAIFHHFPSTLGILVTANSPSAPTLGPATYTTPAGPLTVPWAVSVGSGTLEFFANNYTTPTDCEGQLYLGSWPVVSGSPATIPGAIPTGYKWISATVTTSDNTSDFSSCTAASGLSPSPGGSPSGGTSPLLAGSLVSVGAALADGDRTVGPPAPPWSVAPGSARAARDGYFANLSVQRDGTAFVFGSLQRRAFPGSLGGAALPAALRSRSAPPVEVGWDLLANGEPSLFGS